MMEMPVGKSLGQTLDEIGFGVYHWKLLVICGFGWLSDCMWIQAVASILPQVQIEFQVPTAAASAIPSCLFSGMFVGATLFGFIADAYGRMYPFFSTMFLTSLCSCVSIFSPSLYALCITVFLVGVSVGGNMPVDSIYYLEFCPPRHQSSLTSLSVFFSLGSALTSLVAFVIFDHSVASETQLLLFQGIVAWRVVLFILSMVCLLLFVCRVALLRRIESPKHLLVKGRQEEAFQVLSQLISDNHSQLTLSLDDIILMDDEVPDANEGPSMFDCHYRVTSLLLFCIWICINFAYTAFNALLAKFMQLKGVSSQNTYISLLIYTCASIPAVFMAMALVDNSRFQRKGTLSLSSFLTGCSILLFCYMTDPSSIVASASLANIFATMMYAVLYTYTPEVFPTPIRARANGVCGALGRVAGIVAPIVAGASMSVSIDFPLWLSTAALTLAAILSLLLPIETMSKPLAVIALGM